MEVRSEMRQAFDLDGFIKLTGLLDDNAVASLERHFEQQFADAPKKARRDPADRVAPEGEFSRFVPYADAYGSAVEALLSGARFRAIVAELDDTPCVPTQALAFELQTEQEGLEWHFGFRSFNYIRPEDMGYTLWIPLDPVEVAGQHGGMAVVSERVYSGREETKMFSIVCREHKDDAEMLGRMMPSLPGFSAMRNAFLGAHAIEYDFKPGDALLFNRYVFHKSCQLRPGSRRARRAFVIRFVSADARFDRTLMRSQLELFTRLNITVATSHGEKLSDLEHGDRIDDSQYTRPPL